ncbi:MULTISPECIES: oxygen-insensitive NADPH nitroreductase [unclassified Neisseria]|uniref:oxygen-insensitive NADPH nitroreductase n=1 Tax=unclassified Neisseria TaxID=2623750 RepID=UPI00107297E6|nr:MULTISPECIES: oxygen-insensitive NADPH nitroreductase [unclassified Neisseria]MBF0802768.1 oxygen-insensitive NADPH nitroreductase [Neisseria sp. 19428wB4_WF04]TFU44567.1 oxygen-insensitive NADPH nitroreductase [Neisseria sp. WF04]
MLKSKPTLETIFAHRSIRQFTQQPVSDEILDTLVRAGQQASTSNNLQCVSIIRVSDPALRQGIREAAGSAPYIVDCAEFLLFCIDFSKHRQIFPDAQLDWAEISLIGAVDAGILAQNVLLAAESLGLSGVYIGALRNDAQKVSDILNLPEYCIPLIGLCLGYPDQDPPFKPRLPKAMVYAENACPALNAEAVESYNQAVADYYVRRKGKTVPWKQSLAKTLGNPVRPHMLVFLRGKGLLKR